MGIVISPQPTPLRIKPLGRHRLKGLTVGSENQVRLRGGNRINVRKPVDYSAMFAALDILMATVLLQMELYCEIGELVSGRPEKGAAVTAAEHLQIAYPDASGFSPGTCGGCSPDWRPRCIFPSQILLWEGGTKPFFLTQNPNFAS